MENQFVPGPWELDSAKIEPRGGDEARYYIINGQLPKGINGDFCYPVADTMNRHHCISPEEDAANGKLIAAAPELLEALIVALPFLSENEVPSLAAKQLAKAAIRKAGGASPESVKNGKVIALLPELLSLVIESRGGISWDWKQQRDGILMRLGL